MIDVTMTDSNERPPKSEEIGNLVVLQRFRELAEAELAKSVLESTGIKCVLRTVELLGGSSNALGGIKVCVGREDAGIAAKILGQEIPESFDVEGVGQFKQPRCPNCQSLDISLRDWDRRFVRFVVGVPGPTRRSGRIWLCHSCNHEWPDSDDFSDRDIRPEQ
jgi:hypothetical protein